MKKMIGLVFAALVFTAAYSNQASALDRKDITENIQRALTESANGEERIQKLNEIADLIGDDTSRRAEKEWALYLIGQINMDEFGDYRSALAVFTTLAQEFNNADAHEIIGDIYYFGKGDFDIDYVKAVEWYSKYIKLEQDPDIMVRYASLLATGEGGIEKNELMAWYYFHVAFSDNQYLPGYFGAYQTFVNLRPIDKFKVQEFMMIGQKSSLFKTHNLSE